MSDTPTPADRCPTCDSDDRLWRNKTGGKVLGLTALCPDPWHSSPVDSPEADTPNPADGPSVEEYMERLRQGFPLGAHQRWAAKGYTEDAAELDWWNEAYRWAVEQLERRVVAVPDGLPERLRDIAEGMDQVGGFNEDAGFVRAAAALLDPTPGDTP